MNNSASQANNLSNIQSNVAASNNTQQKASKKNEIGKKTIRTNIPSHRQNNNITVKNNLERIQTQNAVPVNLFKANATFQSTLSREQIEELEIQKILKMSEESYKQEEEMWKRNTESLRKLGVEVVSIIIKNSELKDKLMSLSRIKRTTQKNS